MIVATSGQGGPVGFLSRLLGKKDDEPTPTLSDEYRHAGPRDVVEQGGTTMSGPGGAPQEDLSSRSVATAIAKLIDGGARGRRGFPARAPHSLF